MSSEFKYYSQIYINVYLYKYNISKITKNTYKDYHLISRLRLFINFL